MAREILMNHSLNSSMVKDIEHPSESLVISEGITGNLSHMKKLSKILSSTQHMAEHQSFDDNEVKKIK